MPPPTRLELAASTFVGVVLLLTFFGRVAALTFATDGMRDSDSARMLDAIRDLPAAAASKVVTSIAGVGLSVFLYLLERALTSRLRKNLDALSSAVELGIRVETDAIPPQWRSDRAALPIASRSPAHDRP